MKVAEILESKGHHVVTVRPQEIIETLCHRFRMEGIGSIVVSTDGKTIDGIIFERDIVHGLAVHGSALLDKPASELMTRSVITCRREDAISDLMKIMTHKRVRQIPVVDGGMLVGVVSVGDVVKHRLDELQLEVNVMRDYAIASH